jgi:hypothetical protein
MPKFISIQDGAYLLNLAHIVSIEVNIDDNGVITDYEVFTNDGNNSYSVDDPGEMAKLTSLIEVV